ncbi:GMC oxidoreductase [Macrolepiota fuliginosa MF-IS2]|uniref:GMC oxidoreductase n=1 Tax=Macrolepiota fuliginosa MF-IS2 TaxID=1400762 RepID=A0A9P5X057_9AGAR|nr:GMC oxidoreductase [Macrolepiota fuliginosa MF-IS2]
MYTRASASDWNDFKQPSWTAKDLPLMKHLETYQKPVNNDTHGYNGPIAISNGGSVTALAQDFLHTSDAVGIPFSDDLQDSNTSHTSEIWAKYINRHTGRCSGTATAYIHSVMDTQSNLYLCTNAHINHIIFKDNKAIGVAYIPMHNRMHGGKLVETIVKGRKCVVLSSGMLGMPQILERSGMGNKELLKKLDIKVVSDLLGVGEEYQDHYTMLLRRWCLVYHVSNESQTLDNFLWGVPKVQCELFQEWEVSPEKVHLSSNAINARFKICPTKEELKEMGPELNKFWDKYFKDKPDKPVMFGSIVSGAYVDHTLLPPRKYITMFQYLEYLASHGKIHIQLQSPYKELFFNSGFMNNKADFVPIRWSYKPSVDIDIKTVKELQPDGLSVGIYMGTWHQPGEQYDALKVHESIKYSAEDDMAINNWISGSCFHLLLSHVSVDE